MGKTIHRGNFFKFGVGQLLSHISNSSPHFLQWNTRGSQFSLFGQNRQCSHLSSRETMVLVNSRSICWCVLFIQNTVNGVKQYNFKRNEWQNQWFAFLISSCQYCQWVTNTFRLRLAHLRTFLGYLDKAPRPCIKDTHGYLLWSIRDTHGWMGPIQGATLIFFYYLWVERWQCYLNGDDDDDKTRREREIWEVSFEMKYC